jgi:hypothetical protein
VTVLVVIVGVVVAAAAFAGGLTLGRSRVRARSPEQPAPASSPAPAPPDPEPAFNTTAAAELPKFAAVGGMDAVKAELRDTFDVVLGHPEKRRSSTSRGTASCCTGRPVSARRSSRVRPPVSSGSR